MTVTGHGGTFRCMAEFASPRFRGSQVLWDILNDSDPGTLKLQHGDHSEDVRTVQQALFDLGWTMRVQPQHPDPVAFADGCFGDASYAVALAYKTHYGIQHTGAPRGEYSGNVGPRTLALLDPQCEVYDASVERILVKAGALDDPPGTIALGSGPGPNPTKVLGTSGVYWEGTYSGEYGHFTDEESTGTFVVQGAIYARWADEGWLTGPLGFPTSDVVDLGDGTYLADFVGGRVSLDSGGATSVQLWG